MVRFNDDSRRSEAEPEMGNSEVLRLLVEHAPAAIAMLDRNMRYVLASNRWIQDYRLKEDIKGRSHYDLFPEISDHWKEVHQRGLAGETIRADEERFERADGTVQWIKWEVRPWYVSKERVGGLLIITEDVTAWKRAEERLKNSLLQFQSTFENAAVGMSHVSLDGRWLKVNERLCQITGYTRDELLSKTFEDVTHPDDIQPDWVNAQAIPVAVPMISRMAPDRLAVSISIGTIRRQSRLR